MLCWPARMAGVLTGSVLTDAHTRVTVVIGISVRSIWRCSGR
jgi:hypothetical protein